MMRIEHDGRGYEIRCSSPGLRTLKCRAANVAEVQLAVEHYHGGPGLLGERQHWGGIVGCPFCRQMAEEETKQKAADARRAARTR